MLISEAVKKLSGKKGVLGITRKEWDESEYIMENTGGTFTYATSLNEDDDVVVFEPCPDDLMADDWGLVTKSVEY